MLPKPHQAALVLLVALVGCEMPEWGASLPERRPLGAHFETYLPGGTADFRTHSPAKRPREPRDPNEPLSLREALALALAQSPALAGFAWRIRQSEAEQLQAAVLPNPELEAEFENFAGSGEFRGTRALETTVALSQLVELGGKRQKRMTLARQDSKLAGWDYEAKRLEVLTGVTKQFIAVLAMQEKLALAREDLRLAEATCRAVEKRLAAGKAAPTEKTKASIELASGKLRVRRVHRRLLSGRQELASMWGSREPRFGRIAGQLGAPAPLLPVERLVAKLSQNPAVARWKTETAQRRALLELERARGVPDVTVGVGYRHARETEDNDRAMLVTVGVPLPLFDRNRGAIAKARFGVIEAKTSRRRAEVEARAHLEEAYQVLATACDEVRSLRDEILPAAQSAHQATGESFRHGKSDYLNLLDAQRTFLRVREEAADALTRYHQAVADIEALIGEPLDSPGKTQAKAKDTTHDK